jgi:hypothetical protein
LSSIIIQWYVVYHVNHPYRVIAEKKNSNHTTFDFPFLRKLLLILLNRLHLLNILLLKGVHGHGVEAEKGLVGVLDKDVFAFVHAKYHVNNCAHNSPAVVEVQCHLSGKVTGLGGKDTEDDVVVVVLGVGTGYETVIMLVKVNAR